MPPAEALLAADDIGIRFGGLVALEGISFAVRAGECVGLLGPNGAGKTTLFNLIAGVHRPQSGRLLFEGREISRLSPDRRARIGIARTFQITQPFPALTALENVMVGMLAHRRPLARMRAEAGTTLEAVGLAAKRDALAGTLSTGQRKRLELARALAIGPKLLLLDEVTGGVDQPSIPGLVALIGSLRARGITLIVIEHNMQVMSGLADRVVFLDRGRQLAAGTPAELARHRAVLSLYLGEPDA